MSEGIHVDCNRRLKGDGSAEWPFETISQAIDLALSRTDTEKLTIHVNPGAYRRQE